MSRSFPPHAVPSQWFPNGSGAWGSWDTPVTSTTTIISTTTPPEISSTGFSVPSASQGPSSALTGTSHQSVNLKIVIPVCLVAVALAVTLAIIWFRCIRKRSRASDKPEPVDPYPIDVERGFVGIGTQKGGRRFAGAGISRFGALSTYLPGSTTEPSSDREQQLESQLTAVIQKLEALETVVQTSTTTTGHQSSNGTGNWDEQPPDYMEIQSTGGSVEVEAGPGRDQKVEHL